MGWCTGASKARKLQSLEASSGRAGKLSAHATLAACAVHSVCCPSRVGLKQARQDPNLELDHIKMRLALFISRVGLTRTRQDPNLELFAPICCSLSMLPALPWACSGLLVRPSGCNLRWASAQSWLRARSWLTPSPGRITSSPPSVSWLKASDTPVLVASLHLPASRGSAHHALRALQPLLGLTCFAQFRSSHPPPPSNLPLKASPLHCAPHAFPPL